MVVKRIFLLAVSDWKNISRDPLLIFSMVGSLLLALLVRFGVPELHAFLSQHISFSLNEHFLIIIGLVLLMAPLMIGILYGFILLDERDEGLLLYYSITPLTKSGYLYGRLLFPIGITFLLAYSIILIQGIVAVRFASFIPVAFLFALQTPIITMIMATLASNKVEGLALTKVINLCILVPLIDYILASPLLNVVAMFFPVYWPVAMLLENQPTRYWIDFILGIMMTVLWFTVIHYKFQRKIE
jgi:fluoroquinolone transport system permease protein